ncbi:ABC transporter permease [Chitinophaga sp. Cy-1792]|uniref:ABC transporter permease n=1 Tax=Chitinophaga sp. Cy-1792 TaxID=2608339 RepID=UPI00141EF571|nr:ABC transporter permease [Chitinophaga sp. Cy-1792]NIG54657.1 FtsX-like permease family protein [Chitinophaga sp. Cy-1792]
MFRNYITIAWRNLIRYKLFTLINIAGLAVGLSSCWLLLLYVQHETSYENFLPQQQRIYRAVNTVNWTGGSMNVAVTSAPFGPVLQRDYEEVQSMTRILSDGGGTFEVNNKRFELPSVFFTDPVFFNIFQYHFIAGTAASALSTPDAMVITRETASKLFGSPENAMGKTIVAGAPAVCRVTGVIEDLPHNSHMQFQAVRPLAPGFDADGWQNFNLYTYLLLKPGADINTLTKKLAGFYDRYLKDHMGDGVSYHMILQPIHDIHLHSNLDYELGPNGNVTYVYIFLSAAILILLIACINYMNLATARAALRTKEVGLRKVLGSFRWQVAGMFLAESLVMVTFAGIIAMGIVWLSLPAFNQITGTTFSLWDFGVLKSWLAMVTIVLSTSLLAGIYPALVISGFRPVTSLKGLAGNRSQGIFRKVLVVFQFSAAIMLAASAVVAYRQLSYVTHTDLGFNSDQTLSFHLPSEASRYRIPAMKQQLLSNRLILGVAAASNPVGGNDIGSHGYFFEQDGKISESSLLAQNLFVDADFVKIMDIKIAMGRNFSDTGNADRYNTVIVNETLVKKMGWKDPIGKRVEQKIDNKGTRVSCNVIGVVKDFHTYSLQHKIAPLVLEMAPQQTMEDNLYVKVSKEDIPGALKYIESVYKDFDREHDFSYSFLDQNFAKQYVAERRQEKLFMIFTILALFIACLGLLGLAAFMASQRLKEIGVRKVLGASTISIVGLLSQDYLKLLIVAIVIAVPLSVWMMNTWLQHFAYHIQPGLGIFIITATSVLLMALLTVSFYAWKSALTNPAKSLKTLD